MSVYKRPNKDSTSWMIDFTYEDPTSGETRRYRRAGGREVRTRADALQAEREIYTRLTTPPPRAEEVQKDASFADFAGYWKDTRKVDWKPTAYRGYEQILRVHLVPAFGERSLRSISAEDIQRYKAAKSTGPEALSAKTVNNHLGVLSSLFEDAVRWRYAAANPARQIKPCRSDRTALDFAYWTAEESERFLAAIAQVRPRWRAFFLTALRTGLRLGELAALRWEDVDLTRGLVNVRRSYSHGVETKPKGGKSRSVPMSAQLLLTLKEHRLAAGGRERVFVSEDGALLDSNRVKHAFWAGIKAAGVKRIRLHDLRHSFASQLVIAGTSLFKVQALLGHQDPKMTQRYAHLSPETQADAVMVLDGPAAPVAHPWHAGRQAQG